MSKPQPSRPGTQSAGAEPIEVRLNRLSGLRSAAEPPFPVELDQQLAAVRRRRLVVGRVVPGLAAAAAVALTAVLGAALFGPDRRQPAVPVPVATLPVGTGRPLLLRADASALPEAVAWQRPGVERAGFRDVAAD